MIRILRGAPCVKWLFSVPKESDTSLAKKFVETTDLKGLCGINHNVEISMTGQNLRWHLPSFFGFFELSNAKHEQLDNDT